MPNPVYQYQRLETDTTVRVLLLQPAAKYEDPLHTILVHIDRTEMRLPPNLSENGISYYECVSYCWGEHDLSRTLDCEGYDVRITENVDIMLRHLRKKMHERPLWVDAICLNQADDVEKAVQVQLMGDIYKDARKVQVWLGEENEGDRIREIMALVEAAARIDPKSYLYSSRALCCRLFDRMFLDDDMSSVRHFLSRPWFQRRWVLQEVCLGFDVTVRCGAFKLPWHTFATGFRTLDWCMENLPTWKSALQDIHRSAVTQVNSIYQGKASLLTLLWRHHRAQCSDHRDRINALRGIATDINIPPDVSYVEDWTRVFQNFAQAYVREKFGSELLVHTYAFGSLAQKNSKWPSWIPDWSNPRDPRFNWDSGRNIWHRGNLLKLLRFSTGQIPDGRTALFHTYRPETAYELDYKAERSLAELEIGENYETYRSPVWRMLEIMRKIMGESADFSDQALFTASCDLSVVTGIGPVCIATGDLNIPFQWFNTCQVSDQGYMITMSMVLRPLQGKADLFSFIGMSYLWMNHFQKAISRRNSTSGPSRVVSTQIAIV